MDFRALPLVHRDFAGYCLDVAGLFCVRPNCLRHRAHWRGAKGARQFRGLTMAQSQNPRSKRSEEHTSELQSHLNLVCRLLLEKKKRKTCPLETVMHLHTLADKRTLQHTHAA